MTAIELHATLNMDSKDIEKEPVYISKCVIGRAKRAPTLGCSIEISHDIYVSVGRSVVCHVQKCVGGITWRMLKVRSGRLKPTYDTCVIQFDYML